jgi:hypothetical protein
LKYCIIVILGVCVCYFNYCQEPVQCVVNEKEAATNNNSSSRESKVFLPSRDPAPFLRCWSIVSAAEEWAKLISGLLWFVLEEDVVLVEDDDEETYDEGHEGEDVELQALFLGVVSLLQAPFLGLVSLLQRLIIGVTGDLFKHRRHAPR